jgi:beta-glucosidase
LFDNPYVDPDYAQKITNSPEHQQLALKVAQKSIVLLKNDNNLLPLDLQKVKIIAVIGPNAADVHLGGYSRDPGPGNQISILDGIRKRVPASVKVLYAEGCKITTGKQGWAAWYENKVEQPDPKSDAESIQSAVATARKADVAIVVVGENESTNREAWSEKHLGDRDSLDLLGAQEALVRAIVETGKPVVVFLINGRPLSINYEKEHVPAILEGWYLGEMGGTAAANVLFGDVNPGGKLPISFPKSVGQLPDYYDHKPSRNRSYLFDGREPIYPFGFGLSYTQFKFENVRVEPKTIRTGGNAKVSVDVTNIGSRAGDEVAQLYIHQRVASRTRPVKQLRGFQRVSLDPGQKLTVEFTLTPDDLSLIDFNMNKVVEPGVFDVMVGSSSADTSSVPLEVVN